MTNKKFSLLLEAVLQGGFWSIPLITKTKLITAEDFKIRFIKPDIMCMDYMGGKIPVLLSLIRMQKRSAAVVLLSVFD
ncbi:hypothetical protein Xmau_03153 [Xenorhabdus mauleonii]|uniref:Uncharacterized protein n=1 Tax=Xenorhabdus mauleonii TaxID=351675 RepID=A0A1I3VC60_9GAMM|nr:hypothetical protein Xmau_03153 [Xenorhabdus mauleonii]SFJ92603.1 hypothetical protein SAMN05421680_12017 [Xenorhabdus mauleonii]